MPGPAANRPGGSEAVVDRIRRFGPLPVVSIMVVAVAVTAYVYWANVSRLWLVVGAIGGGALTLAIFALSDVRLGRPAPRPEEEPGRAPMAS
jgi:hypothetical protein